MASSSSFIEFPSLPPTSILPGSFLYDVFLSFRGKDTRNNFTGHLYDLFVMVGIRTFMDNDELQIGGDISHQLLTAIDQSRIYIVVFSHNYADSRWCLDELVKILECSKKIFRVVIPIFYDIEPSEVRGQRGSFEEAFANHEAKYVDQMDMVERWRTALTQAANLSGFHFQTSALGSESRLISSIIEVVLSQVKPKKLFVAKYPIGLDSRVNEVYPLLRLESDNHDIHVRLIGIWGMGGSGKTVIAKALYNKIHPSFESNCFLANVREVSEQPNGLVKLQETLLNELLMRKNVNVGSVHVGKEMIRERLCRKTVLIVLDDLDHLSQVDALAGDRSWFGPRSVIIMTARDHHLLNHFQIDAIYPTPDLKYSEALELFSWHAFKKGIPEEPYAVIADKFISYSGGLPLALEVLGAFLFGRTIQQWNSAFESLQKIPDKGIQQILKISYDGLGNDEWKEIFLDIAFFFIGMDLDYVTEILNGCGFSTEIGIEILINRCLLTVNSNNELMMHDLLRDMGREIIRQPFPWEPGMRSRLWSYQDVTDVLMRNQATKAIQGVTLVSPIKEEIHLNTKKFAGMDNLRLLQMDKVNLNGNFKYLSKEFRWISWHHCSLKHLPPGLQIENLVVLDMQHSKMRTVWQGNRANRKRLIVDMVSCVSRRRHEKQIQFLGHLKILNLSHSKSLTSTPDFASAPSILTLILEGCTSLRQIDPSIGCLDSLLVLNLKGCEKITNIPSEICSLRLLGHLNLSGCSNLKELPDNLGSIVSLRELYADETAITKLPSSLHLLVNLTCLSLRGYTNWSFLQSIPELPPNIFALNIV